MNKFFSDKLTKGSVAGEGKGGRRDWGELLADTYKLYLTAHYEAKEVLRQKWQCFGH